MRLTPSGLMEALSISKATYQALVKDEMPCIRVGKGDTAQRRFDLKEVEEWLRKRREPKEDSGE